MTTNTNKSFKAVINKYSSPERIGDLLSFFENKADESYPKHYVVRRIKSWCYLTLLVAIIPFVFFKWGELDSQIFTFQHFDMLLSAIILVLLLLEQRSLKPQSPAFKSLTLITLSLITVLLNICLYIWPDITWLFQTIITVFLLFALIAFDRKFGFTNLWARHRKYHHSLLVLQSRYLSISVLKEKRKIREDDKDAEQAFEDKKAEVATEIYSLLLAYLEQSDEAIRSDNHNFLQSLSALKLPKL